jgi:hypothetical protein
VCGRRGRCGLAWACTTRWHYGQAEHKVKVIVGGDAVEALEAAEDTAMDEHMLAVGPLESADGLHEAAAGAGSVAAGGGIDVARPQAERAVIAMMAAAG